MTRLRADALFVSRFQRAPQAACPSIIRGSFVARSKKIASVGETMITSRAMTPLCPTSTNSHPAAAAEAAAARRKNGDNNDWVKRITLNRNVEPSERSVKKGWNEGYIPFDVRQIYLIPPVAKQWFDRRYYICAVDAFEHKHPKHRAGSSQSVV